MITVQGRLLEQPKIMYHKGSKSHRTDDRARWNLQDGARVFRRGHLHKCAILRMTRDGEDQKSERTRFDETFPGFLNTLRRIFDRYNVSDPVESWCKTLDKGDEAAIDQKILCCKNEAIRMLLIVLPDNDASTYNQTKKSGDIEYDI